MKQQHVTDATCKMTYLQLFLNLTDALGSSISSIFGRVVKVFSCKFHSFLGHISAQSFSPITGKRSSGRDHTTKQFALTARTRLLALCVSVAVASMWHSAY